LRKSGISGYPLGFAETQGISGNALAIEEIFFKKYQILGNCTSQNFSIKNLT